MATTSQAEDKEDWTKLTINFFDCYAKLLIFLLSININIIYYLNRSLEQVYRTGIYTYIHGCTCMPKSKCVLYT